MEENPSPHSTEEQVTFSFSKKKLIIGLVASILLLLALILVRSESFNRLIFNPQPTPTPTTIPTPSPAPKITFSVTGQIIDEVDKGAVSGATVGVGSITTETTAEGTFELSKVPPGEQTLSISKTGYQSKTQEISLTENLALDTIGLFPAGRIVFVSNRSGERTIYTSRLDGQNVNPLWSNPPGVEDYSVTLAPNNSRIVFLSNRDQDKEDPDIKTNLYFTDLSSIDIRRVSDVINPLGVEFFPNSQSVLYLKSDYDLARRISVSELRSFDFDTKSNTVLVENDDFKKETGSTPSLSIFQAQISPNGEWVTFYAFFGGPGHNSTSPSGVYIVNASGKGLRLLVARLSVSGLKFAPDGGSITYKAYTDDNVQKTYRYDLVTNTEREINAEEASIVLNAAGGPYSSWPAEVLSHNGTKVAFRDYRDGRTDLFVKNKGANTDQRLTQKGGVDRIFWTPSDRYLIFSTYRADEIAAAYIVGLTEVSEPVKISEIYGGDSLAGFLP